MIRKSRKKNKIERLPIETIAFHVIQYLTEKNHSIVNITDSSRMNLTNMVIYEIRINYDIDENTVGYVMLQETADRNIIVIRENYKDNTLKFTLNIDNDYPNIKEQSIAEIIVGKIA